MSLGENIKKYRKLKGLTQEELAICRNNRKGNKYVVQPNDMLR